MKKRPHKWRHGKMDEHGEFAEHRTCLRCGVIQYAYGQTDGTLLFWLPEVAPRCQ